VTAQPLPDSAEDIAAANSMFRKGRSSIPPTPAATRTTAATKNTGRSPTASETTPAIGRIGGHTPDFGFALRSCLRRSARVSSAKQILELRQNRLHVVIDQVPGPKPADCVERSRCLVGACVGDGGMGHAGGRHLMHGVGHSRFAQSATTMIGMGADGLEEAGAIHGIVPADGERGEASIGSV
jgi:hypothetical protein